MFKRLDDISLDRVTEIVHYLLRVIIKEKNETSYDNMPPELRDEDIRVAHEILRESRFEYMSGRQINTFSDQLYDYLEEREEKEYMPDIDKGKRLISKMRER